MPPQASTIAGDVDLVYDIITWISIFFFVAIVVVMVYFMIKYRRTSHVASTEGATHHTPLEVTWTIIPLILVIAIFYVGLTGYVNITTPPENAYEIEVQATQWSWWFNYPNGAKEQTLYVPAGQPVKLTMSSGDVLHALYIPDFRVKQDIVPGRTTELWFQTDFVNPDPKTGLTEYPLYCAEYCGTEHSDMVTSVVAMAPLAFEQFIAESAVWIDKVPDADLYKAGVLLYAQCASCHTVDGSPKIGPSFKETNELFRTGGSRRLADGSTVLVDEAYLRKSLADPLFQIAFDEATGKPYASSMTQGLEAQLGQRRAEAVIQFLMRLDELLPDGTLIEVNRADIVVEDQEVGE